MSLMFFLLFLLSVGRVVPAPPLGFALAAAAVALRLLPLPLLLLLHFLLLGDENSNECSNSCVPRKGTRTVKIKKYVKEPDTRFDSSKPII